VGIVLNSVPLNNVSFQRTLVGDNLATWFESVSRVLRLAWMMRTFLSVICIITANS